MELKLYRYQPEVGWDTEPDPTLDSAQTLVIAFGVSNVAPIQHVLEFLRNIYASSVMTGCSTAGEILDKELFDGCLVVAVVRFRQARIQNASVTLEHASDSYAAGCDLAERLTAPALKGVFVLSKGLNVNGTSLIAGLNSVLPKGVVITGGLAGDGDRFQKTWVLAGSEPASDQVCAVGFYGDSVRIGHGSRGGWDLLGPERVVTAAEHNVLNELDGQPALEVYKRYLGERASELPAAGLLFPLAIRNENESDGVTVRTILAVDEKSQSITFAGDIPSGSRVRLMRANLDRLIDGAVDAAGMVELDKFDAAPLLSLAISCVGRRLVLGERTEEGIEAPLGVLPPGTHQIGFYSYGEISPLTSGRCDLHNQTMTLTLIGEAG